MTMDQDFLGKRIHCRNVFFLFLFFFSISIAQWSDEEDNTVMTKVAKSKGKTRGKNGKKLENVLRS